MVAYTERNARFYVNGKMLNILFLKKNLFFHSTICYGHIYMLKNIDLNYHFKLQHILKAQSFPESRNNKFSPISNPLQK